MKYERCPYCAYNTLDLDSHLKSHNKVRELLLQKFSLYLYGKN